MKINKNQNFLLIVLLLFTPFLNGGIMSINPATNEEELVFISAEEERKMGANIAKEIKKHYDFCGDPLLQKRVQDIGERLAYESDRKDVTYRFSVIKDKEENKREEGNYNAIAIPGGYIYIFEDLAKVLETDKVLAAVLAHEMGHIEARHSIKRLQGNLGITALMLLSTQMNKEEGEYRTANIAIGQLMSAYSRQDERQADELSVKYLRKTGFDASGSIDALTVLRTLMEKAPRRNFPAYKTHPYVSERIAYLKKDVTGYTDFNSYINLVSDERDRL